MNNENQIIDKIVTIEPPEGGWKREDLQIIVCKNNGKSILSTDGDTSSGINWTTIQQENKDAI